MALLRLTDNLLLRLVAIRSVPVRGRKRTLLLYALPRNVLAGSVICVTPYAFKLRAND
jgi:hypothetical protein